MYNKAYFLLSILFFSCAQEQDVKTIKYFDIKALFNNQMEMLAKQKPVFNKEVEINSEKEIKDISNINWEKELSPFIQSDINKPAFLGSYDIIETDSTLKYSLKTGEKKPISSISITKSQQNQQIKFINIASSDENMLYRWEKHITATFEEGNLKKYTIKGKQKILVFDEENYNIMGKRK
jgi:hypothetical protein